MSFFDLENELPVWLDEVIKESKGFKEIRKLSEIKKTDKTSEDSYHLVCAEKGNMVKMCAKKHQIWKFQASKGNIRAYGKYIKYNGNKPPIKFWIGLMVEDKTMYLSLWFVKSQSALAKQNLIKVPDKERGKYGYWYKEKDENAANVSETLTKCCECGSNPLSKKELDELKEKVKKTIGALLEAVKQAGKDLIN